MDPRVENFLKRPIYQRVLVLVLLLVLLVAGFYYGLYEGQLTEMQNLEKRLTTSEAKLAESRRIAANLPAFKAEYERLQAQLKDALSELPDKKEIPTLLRNIGKLASDQGLDVLTFTPAGEVDKGFYAEVPVDLKLNGSYHDVALFFDAVGNLPRIVNIGNLSMGQPKDNGGRTTLSISCRATTFRFIDK
jgi:type IV pilus assembly protein PilO